MGARGPAPKRAAQRRRKNKPQDVEPVTAPGARKVTAPRPDPKWHPVAKRWYLSLARSGQAIYYEPSDYATAFVIAESMSRALEPIPIVVGSGQYATVEMHSVPPPGASIAAWLKGMTALMVTEGDRRRVRLELERPAGEEATADVSELAEYRSRLNAV